MNEPISGEKAAFPWPKDQNQKLFSMGVNLRDYFAAAALQAIISSALSEGTKTMYNIRKPDFLECLSLDAYAHADAMLKAREAK